MCLAGAPREALSGSTAHLAVAIGETATQTLMPRAGYAEGYFNNTCVLPTAGAMYARIADCPGGLKHDSHSIAALTAGLHMGNNTIYCPGGEPIVSCGNLKINTTELHARGYDRGTVVHSTVPTYATIFQWAAKLLGI